MSIDDTNKVKTSCPYHIDHKSRIGRNEKDIQDIWKEINGMKKLLITTLLTSCGSLLLLVVTIVKDIAVK